MTPDTPHPVRLVYPRPEHQFPDDVARLVQVAHEAGFLLDPHDAALAWDEYSDMFASGWLGMTQHTNAQLLNILTRFLVQDPPRETPTV